MSKLVPILTDICVVFFDLLIFTRMITLKRDTHASRALMYGGCGVIIALYFMATYVWSVPAAVASFACMTLPSMALFFLLCKYKDARFFLTFCFVDTVTLIMAFFARYLGILFGETGALVALVVVFALFLAVYLAGKPYFGRYRKLLAFVDSGWNAMMVSAALIYFALIFFAAYPKPLVERIEYGLVYLVFSLVVLSCYVVFILSVVKTKQLHEQRQQLLREHEWHRIAYVDGLTGCYNRMAYMEKINELERVRTPEMSIAILVFDLDDFKRVNDTLGHHMGDTVLKAAADMLKETFEQQHYTIFRIGGDEFAIIAQQVCEAQVREKLAAMREAMCRQSSSTLSAGYAFVHAQENNAVEQAFVRADQMMYADKRGKKRTAGAPDAAR
nr:GGDEF domain-containing protein [Maliibacterium massiliense]